MKDDWLVDVRYAWGCACGVRLYVVVGARCACVYTLELQNIT